MPEANEGLSEQEIGDIVADKILGPVDEEPEEKPVVEEPKPVDEEPEAEVEATESDTEAEESTPESEGIVEVELEGKVYQVPPELKDVIHRHADYTRKTTEHAGRVKEFEVQSETLKVQQTEIDFTRSVQNEINQIAAIDQELQQFKEMDWTTMTTDELVRQQAHMNQQKDLRQDIYNGIVGKGQTFQAEQKQAMDSLMEKGQQVLNDTIPNWDNEQAGLVTKHMLTDGYSEAEAANLVDPRHVRTLWKAMQYDKLVSGTAKARQRVEEAPPIVAPKATGKTMSDDTKSLLNYKKEIKKATSTGERQKIIERRMEKKLFG